MLSRKEMDRIVNQFRAEADAIVPPDIKTPELERLQLMTRHIVSELEENLACGKSPELAEKLAYRELGKIIDARMANA